MIQNSFIVYAKVQFTASSLLNIRTLSRNSDVCIDQNVNMESSELLNILTGQRTRVFLSTVSALAFPSGRKNITKSHQIFLS